MRNRFPSTRFRRTFWTIGGLLIPALLLSVSVAQERTSENNENLKRLLKSRPQADANRDGILTTAEAKAFQAKTRPGRAQPAVPKPDLVDVPYGEHKLQTFDLWKAKSDRPTPLVMYIHGGGFRAGDKRSGSKRLLSECLASGISYAAINYRLTPEVCFPATHLDCVRAVQTLRHKAEEWNLDPTRFASTGGSAGAGISLWLAMKDEMADPQSQDPIARQSTRLSCVAVNGGQCSYDPFFTDSIGLPRLATHSFFYPFYGITEAEFDSPRARKLYKEAAAITYASADDVPVLMDYSVPNDPVTDETSLGAIVHHPKFGIVLKEKLDELGVECIVQYPGHPEKDKQISQFDFISGHFGMPSKSED